jgi:aspartate/tyrosine/aromatic aminotransferase
MLSNGRVCMCGLNSENISRIAEAIHDAVTKVHN